MINMGLHKHSAVFTNIQTNLPESEQHQNRRGRVTPGEHYSCWMLSLFPISDAAPLTLVTWCYPLTTQIWETLLSTHRNKIGLSGFLQGIIEGGLIWQKLDWQKLLELQCISIVFYDSAPCTLGCRSNLSCVCYPLSVNSSVNTHYRQSTPSQFRIQLNSYFAIIL